MLRRFDSISVFQIILKAHCIRTLISEPFVSCTQDASKEAKPEPPKNEDPKFQPFSGKKYSLRG